MKLYHVLSQMPTDCLQFGQQLYPVGTSRLQNRVLWENKTQLLVCACRLVTKLHRLSALTFYVDPDRLLLRCASQNIVKLKKKGVIFTKKSLSLIISSPLRVPRWQSSDSSFAKTAAERRGHGHQSCRWSVSNMGAERDEGITSTEIRGQASHTHTHT